MLNRELKMIPDGSDNNPTAPSRSWLRKLQQRFATSHKSISGEVSVSREQSPERQPLRDAVTGVHAGAEPVAAFRGETVLDNHQLYEFHTTAHSVSSGHATQGFIAPTEDTDLETLGLCQECKTFEKWLQGELKPGAIRDTPRVWEPAGNKPYEMGLVKDIAARTQCRLCTLATTALSDSFVQLPLTYGEGWGQAITLGFQSVAGSTSVHALEVGAEMTLSSYPLALSKLQASGHVIPGMKYGAEIRMVIEDSDKIARSPAYGAFGRLLTRGECNMGLIYEAYHDCRKNHGAVCETSRHEKLNPNGESDLRDRYGRDLVIWGCNLIDVDNMCVVSAMPFTRYVALSYVWGREPFLKATMSNIERLQSQGSLSNEDLPRTIKEAIELTRLLNEHYLWVDCLCIVQDDEVSKLENISKMDQIYLSATLTIIAADGDSVHHGLTGFAPGSRSYKQPVASFAGLRFVTVGAPILEELKELPWFQRAWCLQEFMLSKRILIFTNKRTFFQCTLQNSSEDSAQQPAEKKAASSNKVLQRITEHPLWLVENRHQIDYVREFRFTQNYHRYKTIVQDLSTRSLTVQTDILKSVTGVLNAMSKIIGELYICGLPMSMLEWSLTWTANDVLRPRGCTSNGHQFPSWSWTGWVGASKYSEAIDPLNLSPLIKDWNFLEDVAARWQETQQLAPPTLPRDKPDVNWTPTQWQKILCISREPVKLSELGQNGQKWNIHSRTAPPSSLPLIETGFLRFRAEETTFYIDTTPCAYTWKDFDASKTASYRVLSIRGDKWVGTVHLPLNHFLAQRQSDTSRVKAEFIAIAATHCVYDQIETLNVGQGTFDTGNFKQLDVKTRAIRMYNVMWIAWRGDIAYRVAIGQIHIEGWKRYGKPVSKTITLG